MNVLQSIQGFSTVLYYLLVLILFDIYLAIQSIQILIIGLAAKPSMAVPIPNICNMNERNRKG